MGRGRKTVRRGEMGKGRRGREWVEGEGRGGEKG